MLTAAAGVDDRVDGLNLGADDYLGKPFAFAELMARVRALARRGPSRRRCSSRRPGLRPGPPPGQPGGPAGPLTRKELGVLEELLTADGAVVSAEDLLERVWDEHADPFTSTVTVTVDRLRRKLGEPDPIETVVGSGYRLP